MNRLLGCVCLLICSLSGWAQVFPTLSSQRFYDNLGEDIPRKLVVSTDGQLIMGGNTLISEPGEEPCYNIWILKVDTLGKRLWEKEVAISGCEELRDMIATQDGGILFAGVSSSLVSPGEKGDEPYWGDFLLGKIDSLGTLEWLESYGGSNLDQANAIAEGIYREFMVVGSTHSKDGDVPDHFGKSDLWALKVDSNGKPRLNQVLGGAKNEWGNAVALCQNGDYLIAGFGNSPSAPNARLNLSDYGNGWVLRMSQQGKVIWQQNFACPFGGYFVGIRETQEGEIWVVGNQHDGDIGYDTWWIKLTGAGEMLLEQQRKEKNEEYLTGMDVAADGTLILTGYSLPRQGNKGDGKGGEDFWLMKLSSAGEVVWRQTFGGPLDERGASVLAYREGVYYALGEKVNRFTRGMDQTDRDFWLIRVEELPEDSLEADIFVRAKEFRVNRATPTRFRAIHNYGDRFLWDFGDGTYSQEEQPLKSYQLSGMYQVRLTVFANENCRKTVTLEKELEVW
ncbi:MAG: PKD domain-containing protein [Bacteroidota bacterium]